jgi:hypothetical protein
MSPQECAADIHGFINSVIVVFGQTQQGAINDGSQTICGGN